MTDTWVVNASPIIALAKVDQLHLLSGLCMEVLVPEAVVAEILAGPPSDPARQTLQQGWGRQVPPQAVSPSLIEWGLGAGETAVLAVAMEKRLTAVLDDAAARTSAKALGIPVIGTLGGVLRAKTKGLIPSAAAVLASLQANGLWLDKEVLRSALKGVGETA